MKNLFYFLLLFSSMAFGQIESFTAENRQVTWQKVFENSLPSVKLLETFKNIPNIKITSSDNGRVDFTFENYSLDYKGAGSSYMMTNIYITTGLFSGKGYIESKEGKYRVTLLNMVCKYKNTGNDFNISEINDTLENIALKNGTNEFRGAFKKDSKIFNYSFTNTFDMNKYTPKESNW